MSALNFTPARTALATNMTVQTLASGGVPPYTYSVVSGGAGGTISPTGLFTAPNAVGVTTIKVTDSTPVTPLTKTALMIMMSPVELVCDIIQTELGLSDGRVYIYDQKINSPSDYGLYVAVSILSCKPFGNTNTYSSGINTQSVNIMASLDINVISRDRSAIDKKELVLMALNSLYSQRQQGKNSFRVFPITTAFRNLSEIDGAAIPYRFNLSVNVQYMMKRIEPSVEYVSYQGKTIVTEE